MSGFDATPAERQLCGTALAQLSDEVLTELRLLESELDGLPGSGWQGEAAEGFAQGWQQWHAGAREVLDALASMGRLLGVTGQNYEGRRGNACRTGRHAKHRDHRTRQLHQRGQRERGDVGAGAVREPIDVEPEEYDSASKVFGQVVASQLGDALTGLGRLVGDSGTAAPTRVVPRGRRRTTALPPSPSAE